jgi:PAS domain-containing protein/anti-sigma regulatory factor (Ser/Thr protein kinase)
MQEIETILNDPARLEALYSYQILDSGTDADFDGIAEVASLVCNTPIALITFLDEHRQWIKARKGIDINDTSCEDSFCQHTLQGDDILIVKDTLQDDRFAYSPFVTGGPQFRFYAGVPLTVGKGYKLGTLCVLGKTPGQLSSRQIMDLKILARQVVNLLDLRIRNLQLQDLLVTKTSELSHVFDRIGEAFLELDKNWNYIYANKRLGELVHRDPASLIGKNIWAEFPQAIGSATYQAFHQAMREQRYICHVDYYPPLNLWQENHIYPSPSGLSVFIRDISERKTAEQQLTKSLESLERAEEQAKMGHWFFDITTGKRTWSKQLFIMFGFHPADEPPAFDQFVDRVHPEDQPALIESFKKMKAGVDPGESIMKTNPQVLPLRYVLRYTRQVKDEKGSLTGFEGIMIDITELQKTNQELDRFVYSVSHDLRAPLSTILGLIKVAELEQPDEFNHTYYKIIRDQINRLDDFIRDILDYSFNTRTEITKDKIDFHSLMELVKQRVKPFTQQEKIKVDVEISGDSPLYTDQARLEIILNNLYSNSIKFQDTKKGHCHIQIRVATEGDVIVIHYSDNGIGIEAAHLDKIFNMFYRASNSSKGSGLGLYIAKETVSKLGGKINVSSVVDRGSTFEIRIPN